MQITYIRVLKGFVSPLLALVTLIGNVLVIIVYYKQCNGGSSMRKSNNTFLISLSLTFIVMIIMPLPWHIYAFTLGNLESNFTINMCFLDFIYGTLPIIPHAVTLLIACAISIQRYTAIRYPLKANLWWSYKKAVIIVVLFYFVSVLIHSIGYLPAETLQRNVTLNIMEEMSPGMCTTILKYREYIRDPVMFGIIWLILRNIFLGTIPNIILLSFVIATVKLLRRRNYDFRSEENRYGLEITPNIQYYGRHKDARLAIPNRVISCIALTASVVEIFTNVLVILNVIQMSNLASIETLRWFRYIYQFQYILLLLGTNSVFFHNCLMNASFRKDLKDVILSCFS